MATFVEWIAAHALLLWMLLPLLAVLVGDLAWQSSMRRRTTGDRQSDERMKPRTVATLGLLAALVFTVVAVAVGSGRPAALLHFDTALAAGMHAQLPSSALAVLSSVSLLGGTPWVASASTLLLLVLVLRRQTRLAICWAVAQIGILPIAYSIKTGFRRTRPPHDLRFVTDTSWSFPSGHAISSAVFYGMLAYVLLRLLPACWHRPVLAVTLLLAGLIGLSRILLQAHYFTDVLAGYACGLAWLMLCIGLAEHLRRRDVLRHTTGTTCQ